MLADQSNQPTDARKEQIDRKNIFAKIAAIGSLLLDVSPCQINNPKDLANALIPHLSPEVQAVLNRLEGSIGTLTTEMKELVLHFVVHFFNNSPPFIFFRNLAEQSIREKAQVDQFRREVEDALIPKCPRCKRAFMDWSGCFSVYCPCGCSFCGHCLADCGSDAHAHVYSQHGGYFGTDEQFKREYGVIAVGLIRTILARAPPHLSDLLSNQVAGLLRGNSFFIRPEQVLQQNRGRGNQLNPGLPPMVGILSEIMSRLGFILFHLQGNEGESIPDLVRSLDDLFEQIHQYHFMDQPDKTSAFTWVHAIIWELSGVEGGGIQPLDQNGVQEKLKAAVNKYPNHLQLLVNFDQKCQNHMKGVLQELQVSEADVAQMNFGEESQRKFVWLSRSLFNFTSQLWLHVKANSEMFPLLILFNEKKSSLEEQNTSRSFRIVRFLGELQKQAKQKRIRKTDATKEGSFLNFVRQAGEPLSGMLDQFKKDFVDAMDDLVMFECQQEFYKLYEHMANGIPENTKLELFLPVKSGPGVLSMALWHGREGDNEGDWTGLPNVQNQLYRLIHGDSPEAQRESRSQALSPYSMTQANAVAINSEDILNLIYDLFLVPGFHPKLADDLILVERLCMYGGPRLASYPYLQEELPEFEYYGFEGLLNLIRSVYGRLMNARRKYLPLPSSLSVQFDQLVKNAPHASELIFAFCAAVLVQESREENPLDSLVSRIQFQIPLSDEQQSGRAILGEMPNVVSSLKVDHIPALMGFCLRGKNYVDETANLPMSQDDLEDLRRGLRNIEETKHLFAYIPDILSEIRVAALSHFVSEIGPANQETPISFFCEFFVVDLECYDELEYNIPFSIPGAHVWTLLREIEEAFGAIELMEVKPEKEEAGLVGDDLGEAVVVPFAALRPFLQSHTIEQEEKTQRGREKTKSEKKKPEKKKEEEKEEEESEVTKEEAEIVWVQEFGEMEF
eukprot:CAMPEP_0201485450 /NCGR_PEP_ID=MMETSP0151_2-20130828/9545_1 /ASSEMBLY_ACC=CAM_ASM_000257 /TAXON_ID=200890 /ORGANISM="Paramoeba atlantica, Strain 621/1 / CCAP 1560/9" /LENGTH=958 /DNA_ID=CAMNT_0047869577 /DNA_START=11 /DNA_END=2887 /DNA_ORIENTATION=-